jgi:hypothetical protein
MPMTVTEVTASNINVGAQSFDEAVFDDRWDDVQGFFDEGTGAAALTFEEFRNTGFKMLFLRNNQNDELYMHFQMPHSWNTGSSVRPHLHLVPMADVGLNVTRSVEFGYSYSFNSSGTPIGDEGSWLSGSCRWLVSSSMLYSEHIVPFGMIAPPLNARPSSVLLVRFIRSGSSAADDYTESKDHGTGAANIGLLHFDVHVQKIRAGTVTEYNGY